MSLKLCKIIVSKDGQYVEEFHYADSLRELKKLEGFIAIVSSENVKHPSPEALKRALQNFGINEIDFFEFCANVTEIIKMEEAVKPKKDTPKSQSL